AIRGALRLKAFAFQLSFPLRALRVLCGEIDWNFPFLAWRSSNRAIRILTRFGWRDSARGVHRWRCCSKPRLLRLPQRPLPVFLRSPLPWLQLPPPNSGFPTSVPRTTRRPRSHPPGPICFSARKVPMPLAPLPFSGKSLRTTDSPISYFIQKSLDNPGLISLAAGLVDERSLPCAEVAAAVAAIMAEPTAGQAALQYGSTQALTSLRENVLPLVCAS